MCHARLNMIFTDLFPLLNRWGGWGSNPRPDGSSRTVLAGTGTHWHVSLTSGYGVIRTPGVHAGCGWNALYLEGHRRAIRSVWPSAETRSQALQLVRRPQTFTGF